MELTQKKIERSEAWCSEFIKYPAKVARLRDLFSQFLGLSDLKQGLDGIFAVSHFVQSMCRDREETARYLDSLQDYIALGGEQPHTNDDDTLFRTASLLIGGYMGYCHAESLRPAECASSLSNLLTGVAE